MKPPLLALRGADLGYGGAPVLVGVDLVVEPGTFLGVLGPNGAGKSTLLRAALGLLSPTRGTLERGGGAAGAPRLGYVPQKERLDPLFPLSAVEVVEMGADRSFSPFWGESARERARRAARCLEECGAAEFSGRRYAELSGGQRQRVLIARALASEPELLLLDEPLAGVDAPTQRALLELLRGLRDRGLTTLMVSHRLRAERGLFTHAAWVRDGRVESGTAEEVLNRPAVVAAFAEDA